MKYDGVADIACAPWTSGAAVHMRHLDQPNFLVESSSEFIRNFVPPDYLIDGVLQRRFCYSFTARTGTGKTAVMMRVAAHVALGRELCGRSVAPGRAVYFAGENPDDIRMRWIAMSQQMGFDLNNVEVYFIPGTFSIADMRAQLIREIAQIGETSLVIIDTSAAFFQGKDENSNTEQAAHARMLRSLCGMPGGPCVLIACHPPKNAGDDNLSPRGGGAFLAEVDGNLFARRDHRDRIIVNWQGKFRGPNFPDLTFGLETVTEDRIRDSRGRPIPTVVASPIGETAQNKSLAVLPSENDLLLLQLSATPSASQPALAQSLGWFLSNGAPHKVKVSRTLGKLEQAKLIERGRGGISLTPAGEHTIALITPNQED